MCELFAMSSRESATINLSLQTLAQHGGSLGPHRDGWEVAYYENDDVRCIRDTNPAATSTVGTIHYRSMPLKHNCNRPDSKGDNRINVSP